MVIERCTDYDDERVYNTVCRAVDRLGGIEKYIKQGMRVALKPNLVKKKNPGEAATTHPSVVKAVARLVREAGGIATIVESPGGFFTLTSLKSVYSVCGNEKAAMEAGAELNYNLYEVDVENPEGM
ncbi:MAG TPA: DUF362 domain-containing protein, partial [Bacillota bacterium]|nr:DUF362 domain-containing protein [Bacillota bacterium]